MKKYNCEQFNTFVFAKPNRSYVNDLSNIFFWFLVAVFVIFMLFSRTYTGMSVRGPSMMPTFNVDYNSYPEKEDLVYYTPLKDNDYKRGDIVIAKVSDKDIIKRVIGLPGDKIEIKLDDGDYYVFINNEKLQEDYILNRYDMVIEYEKFTHLFKDELIVPENSLFILGDNRGNSNDSTFYGCFEFSNVLGRVDYIVKADEIPVLSLFLQLFLPIFYYS